MASGGTPFPLEAELDNIVNLGRSWGMSDAEIQECLGSSLIKEDSTKGSFSSWLCFLLKFVIFTPIVLCLTLVLCYSTLVMVASMSPTAEMAISKIGSPYVYPAMRAFRKLMKPLADRWDVSSYYSSQCVINNPFYVDPIMDCHPCTMKEQFVEMKADNVERQKRHVEEMVPFVIREYQKKPVVFEDLKVMFQTNQSKFETGATVNFLSNAAEVTSANQLFTEIDAQSLSKLQKGALRVHWQTNGVSAAQAIRKVFPRPEFILDEAEVSLIKNIYISGSLAPANELPIGGFASSWYQQGEGQRRATLFPHPDCFEECKQMSIVLNPGDLIYYQDQFWRLVMSPVSNSYREEISVGFSGSFTF